MRFSTYNLGVMNSGMYRQFNFTREVFIYDLKPVQFVLNQLSFDIKSLVNKLHMYLDHAYKKFVLWQADIVQVRR
jgi:hypothetical protein